MRRRCLIHYCTSYLQPQSTVIKGVNPENQRENSLDYVSNVVDYRSTLFDAHKDSREL